MSAEAGKLSLDDSPKRFLPYFRLADPAADAQATLKDLLTHRTGLTAYDDEVWHKNDKLSREEVIKAVMSKPATARFRTTFQYNNVMYSAVGPSNHGKPNCHDGDGHKRANDLPFVHGFIERPYSATDITRRLPLAV